MRWEQVARHEGGTVVALTAAHGSTSTQPMLFAATSTGLFCSDDAGQSWSSPSRTPLPLLNTVAISSDHSMPDLLYAGTQTGFFRSADSGQTWRQTLRGGRVFSIAVVPSGEGDKSVFIGTQVDGILRSDDAGQTWVGANAGLLDLTVLALAFSPSAARDQTGLAATTSGLYRTRNGGKSWRGMALPCDESAVQCLAFSPDFAINRLVFAGTEQDGLWRSDDGGTTWDAVSNLSAGGIGAIACSIRHDGTQIIAVATEDAVMLSHDDGETWQTVGDALPNVLSLAFVQDDGGETLVAGRYRDGAARIRVTDSGAEWMVANTGLGATFMSALITSPNVTYDRTLYAMGTEAGILVSRDGGARWDNISPNLADADVLSIAIASDSDAQQIIVAVTTAGIRRSRDGGSVWEPSTRGADGPVSIVTAGIAPIGSVSPLVAATLNHTLIASMDGGERWHSLTMPIEGATIISLAASPAYTHDRTLYVGTTSAERSSGATTTTLWRSTDGGRHWSPWLNLPDGSSTLPLAIPTNRDHESAERDRAPFVAYGGSVWYPRRNAWQTRSGVRAPLWRNAALTTSDGVAVSITALATSPYFHRDRTIFAATSAGVYRSLDGGRSFFVWNDDGASAPVLAISVAPSPNETGDRPPFLVYALDMHGTIWRRGSNG